MIKLSICIATLNRGPFIGETLQSIVTQLTDQVEIIIVDGASIDNTKEIVLQYVKKYENIRYIRLPHKGGLDQDYSYAVELAGGEYCWLFSDDDIIKPGAIEALFSVLKNNPGLVIVNAEVKNADLTQTLKINNLKLTENKYYTASEINELLRDTGNYLSFIGCVVIQRSLWNVREKKKYFGTLFVHVGVILQKPISKIVVIAKPYITQRYGNAFWVDKSFEVTLIKWPELIWSFVDIEDRTKNQICECEPWRNGFRLIFFRARGSYTSNDYEKFLKKKIISPIDKFKYNIISKFPGTLFNILFYFYYKTIGAIGSNAGINLYELENSRCSWMRFFQKNKNQ